MYDGGNCRCVRRRSCHYVRRGNCRFTYPGIYHPGSPRDCHPSQSGNRPGGDPVCLPHKAGGDYPITGALSLPPPRLERSPSHWSVGRECAPPVPTRGRFRGTIRGEILGDDPGGDSGGQSGGDSGGRFGGRFRRAIRGELPGGDPGGASGGQSGGRFRGAIRGEIPGGFRESYQNQDGPRAPRRHCRLARGASRGRAGAPRHPPETFPWSSRVSLPVRVRKHLGGISPSHAGVLRGLVSPPCNPGRAGRHVLGNSRNLPGGSPPCWTATTAPGSLPGNSRQCSRPVTGAIRNLSGGRVVPGRCGNFLGTSGIPPGGRLVKLTRRTVILRRNIRITSVNSSPG